MKANNQLNHFSPHNFFMVLVSTILSKYILYSDLQGWTFTNLDWKKPNGEIAPTRSCSNNQEQLVCGDSSSQIIQFSLQQVPPHYEIQMLADLYFQESYDTGEYGLIKIDNVQRKKYQKYYQTMKHYSNQCSGWGTWTELEVKTINEIFSHSDNSIQIQFQTNLDELYNNEAFCFRNVSNLISCLIIIFLSILLFFNRFFMLMNFCTFTYAQVELYNFGSDWTFSNLDWRGPSGQLASISGCETTNMNLLCTYGGFSSVQTIINTIKPHYQIELLVDLYYLATFDSEYGKVLLDNNVVGSNTISDGLSYGNLCPWGPRLWLTLKTLVYISLHQDTSLNIKFQTNLNQGLSDEAFCFRNVQVWIYPCHSSCLTCTGPQMTDCLTCHNNNIVTNGVCPICQEPKSFLTPYSGCIRECQRNQFIADQNKNCIQDERINEFQTYFSPIDQSFSSYWNVIPSTTNNCIYCGNSYIPGPYKMNEVIQQTFTLTKPSIKSIRLRVTYILFDTTQTIYLFQQNHPISQVQLNEQTNAVHIFTSENNSCPGQDAQLTVFATVRVEYIIQVNSITQELKFSSSKDNWSVRSIYIDEIQCSTNCDQCLNSTSCSQCSASYLLYKGRCITNCPPYSDQVDQRCIDFDQERWYVSYLVKTFYDMTTPENDAVDLFDPLFEDPNDFQKDVKFSYLKDKRIFGGALTWLHSKFGKTFNIPQPHYGIRIRMQVVLGDNFGTGAFNYKFNNGPQQQITLSDFNFDHHQEWGDVAEEYFFQIDETIFTDSDLYIEVECAGEVGQAINMAFCAIQNYFITVFECQPKCSKCFNQYACIDQQEFCGDGIVNNQEECDDGNLIPFDGCWNCKYSCPENCSICMRGECFVNASPEYDQQQELNQLSLVENEELNQLNEKCLNCQVCLLGQCLVCELGWYLSFNSDCQSRCGDNIQTWNEQCDDGNNNQFDDCHQCKITTFLISDINNSFEKVQNCGVNCKQCIDDKCYQCQDGWYLQYDQTCQSICGDQIVAQNEQCDDGNDIKYDGCYECNYQCQTECLTCISGECQECISPYVLVQPEKTCQILIECEKGFYIEKITNECKSKCGDGIATKDEECDDGNDIMYDGCFGCQFQCVTNCDQCIQGVCQSCKTGYKLANHKCYIDCGDGLIIGEEQCDDGNTIPRDGCTKCQIDPNFQCKNELNSKSVCWQCGINCKECTVDACLSCDSGYFLSENKCLKCGESCQECSETPNNCTTCLFADCNTCEYSPGYHTLNGICIEKCGDGVKTINEECDDGNTLNHDGCNQYCKLEVGYNCSENGCIELPVPVYKAGYINQTTTDDIAISMDNDNLSTLCNLVTVTIEQFEAEDFNATISEIEKECQITFDFHKSIDTYNLIHIKIPISESSGTRLLTESTREITITPRKKIYYSQSQVQQAQSVVAASQSFNFILQLIGPLTILLGGFDFFWTILDILTWINNFYFLNIEYPENVKLFFKQLEWGDIIMIPNIITLNSQDDPYYFEAPPKFAEKDIDPLFANNIQLFFGLLCLWITVYFLCRFILKMINFIYPNQKKQNILEVFSLYKIKKVKKWQIKHIPSLIKKTKENCQYFINNKISFLMQILNLVFLDLSLAIVLQLTNKQSENYLIVKINIIGAYLGIVLIIFVLCLTYKVTNKDENLLNQKQYQQFYGSLYDGINLSSGVAKTYNFINLVRKVLFINFTVLFYNNPIIQTTSCCLACGLNISLLIFENPFETKKLLIKNGIPDLCIFIILLITVFFSIDEQIGILKNQSKFIIGWIILGFILLSIFTQLLFLFQQLFRELYRRYQWLMNQTCKRKDNKL